MRDKYQIIYADPAWSYSDAGRHRGGAMRHYLTMSIEEIKQLPVSGIADVNCFLFMWVTFPQLPEAFKVIESWGFIYKTCAFVWVKTNRRTNPNQASFFPSESFDSFWGMGHWTRANAEICLLAIKGKPKRERADVHQVIYAPIGRHSKKPNEARDRIVKLCGDIPRVELFARQRADGWAAWGNQIAGSISLLS